MSYVDLCGRVTCRSNDIKLKVINLEGNQAREQKDHATHEDGRHWVESLETGAFLYQPSARRAKKRLNFEDLCLKGAKCMWKLAAWVTKQVYVTGLCPNLNNWPTPFIYEDGNFLFNLGRAFVLGRSTSNKSGLQKVTWTSLWRSWWDRGQSKEVSCGMRLVNIGHLVLSNVSSFLDQAVEIY